MVGAAGFEPTTPCTPSKCATRLRHAPTEPEALEIAKTFILVHPLRTKVLQR
jgi:hypothetical protein